MPSHLSPVPALNTLLPTLMVNACKNRRMGWSAIMLRTCRVSCNRRALKSPVAKVFLWSPVTRTLILESALVRFGFWKKISIWPLRSLNSAALLLACSVYCAPARADFSNPSSHAHTAASHGSAGKSFHLVPSCFAKINPSMFA